MDLPQARRSRGFAPLLPEEGANALGRPGGVPDLPQVRRPSGSAPALPQDGARETERKARVHRSLSVESPNSTSSMVTIQNRTTTWFSFQPFSS